MQVARNARISLTLGSPRKEKFPLLEANVDLSKESILEPQAENQAFLCERMSPAVGNPEGESSLRNCDYFHVEGKRHMNIIFRLLSD